MQKDHANLLEMLAHEREQRERDKAGQARQVQELQTRIQAQDEQHARELQKQ